MDTMTYTVEPTQLGLLAEADQRLDLVVDALDEETFTRPSLLPDWTVGHVLAHLALNGEGLAGALSGLTTGAGTSMYESPAARDRDIAELGVASPEEIRSRVQASTALFDHEVSALPEDQWETRIERTPGGPSLRARSTVLMRLDEGEPACTVSGESYDLGWWLIGRDDRGRLTVDHDQLPEVLAW